jgi:transposase
MNRTARKDESTGEDGVLYMALELGWTRWKLAFTTDGGEKPRLRSVAARDLPALKEEIERSKQRLGLPSSAQVISCYEAGRDGFWLHRYLDVQKLLSLLMRSAQGGRQPWSVVRCRGRWRKMVGSRAVSWSR